MNYTVMTGVSNLKGDDDSLQYYVEPSDGGGIEFTGTSLQEAENYIRSVNGTLEYLV